MRVCIVHLLREAMTAQILIQLETRPRFVSQRVLVEWRLESDKARGQVGIKREIEVSALLNSLGGTEEKDLVLHNRSTEIGRRIPTVEKGRSARGARNVIGVEDGVPEKCGDSSVPIICSAARHHIDDAAGRVTEFRFVPAGDYLKFQNRILV